MFDFDFKPNNASKQATVPYFDEVKASGGWEGHETSKRMDDLLSELSAAMSKLNGLIINVAEGTYGDRLGFQIHFSIKTGSGQMIPGRLDIACLPLKPTTRRLSHRHSEPLDPRIERTRKMALYMVIKAIKGMWFMEQLSPGFFTLMPAVLNNKGQTLGQLWHTNAGLQALLPPPKSAFQEDVVEGEEISKEKRR